MSIQGPVLFNEDGDRKGLTQIEQLQGNDEVQVGVYNPNSPFDNKITWHRQQPVYWKGQPSFARLYDTFGNPKYREPQIGNHGFRVATVTVLVSFSVNTAVKPTTVRWLNYSTMVQQWLDHGSTMVIVPWLVYHGTAM